MHFRESLTLTVADDATYTFSVGEILILRSDKTFEYNYGGTVYFSLSPDINYEFDNSSNVTVHAPSGGGTVTLSVMVGGI